MADTTKIATDGSLLCICGQGDWKINVNKDYVECNECGLQYSATCVVTASPKNK